MKKVKKNRKQRNRRRAKRQDVRASRRLQTSFPGRSAYSHSDWAGIDSAIGEYISAESRRTLESYRFQPNYVLEHANHEEDTARGGYAYRQLFELVQNAADSLSAEQGGQILVKLSPTHLYCADEGEPIDPDGVKALMFSHLSPKRGTAEIGRFGLGFKSVLGVTDAPDFFSRAGSFRFSRAKAAELIRPIVPDAQRFPILRLPEPINPWQEAEDDPLLLELMSWASNIVRLPLKADTHENLARQLREFPSEFLLFVGHVSELTLENDHAEESRTISLSQEEREYLLDSGDATTRWMVVSGLHRLSNDAKADSRSLDDSMEVPISWAAPLDPSNEPGKFWAFFPTSTASLLSGILNAPWKTNEDRQNLLPGVYNEELINAAASMVADAITKLSRHDDPSSHLDALPRRQEAGDSEQSQQLRDELYARLQEKPIAPDQKGKLRSLAEIWYPPREITDPSRRAAGALERWASFEDRPDDWLHHSALNRNRLAALDRLYIQPLSYIGVPRATIRAWLEALVEDAKSKVTFSDCQAKASRAAIQTAALVPESIRRQSDLGRIVLAADGSWVGIDPDRVFLGFSGNSDAEHFVHPELQDDPETLNALRELGIGHQTLSVAFRAFAAELFSMNRHNQANADLSWIRFWHLTRELEEDVAFEIISELSADRACAPAAPRVRTVAGNWEPIFNVLIPGTIVPADGSRDADVAIDIQFHELDLSILRRLDAVEAPSPYCKLPWDMWWRYSQRCRVDFTRRDLPRDPHRHMLNFRRNTTSGPLGVLELLSDEGRADYTWQLLDLPSTFGEWTMVHDTQPIYPPMDFPSPAVDELLRNGRIRTSGGIRKLSEGIGNPPQSFRVRNQLLLHPQASLICDVFGLDASVTLSNVEPVGEDTPIPVVDVWPGLAPHLSEEQADLQLIRCDGFRSFGNDTDVDDLDCIADDSVVYIRHSIEDDNELRLVLVELQSHLSYDQVEAILWRQTPSDVETARRVVREHPTQEARLLAAVGVEELRKRLPQGLLAILEAEQGPLSGIQIAQAAIATFHTGALREYRHALEHLDPPRQWAGRARAIEFVRALGFGEEWAGDRNFRRDPFLEVDGPHTLPPLHHYQRKAVDSVRELLRLNGRVGERRGMISMPTGSGKTRVAVQAIVEAIRYDEFHGGILWVADRDELCEQAVEAWREVWASEGADSARLRISRMWAGQPQPIPTGEMHVIVATIQTLSARIERQPAEYEFLSEFDLLVFDEAHRSVAPTFTSVMQELGLTRWRRSGEPLLVGLTATPYRGHDERETARLVNRYGSNRLDAGAFVSDDPEEVIRELQSMNVLAQADHDTILGGEFSLSADELRQSAQTPWLPQSVENRIAHDAHRTRRIIEAYTDKIEPDWPVLIFATSVEHSQIIAALLTSLGISARSVSGSTDASVRRRIVEEFRAGEIKALVNYGVFREGFDAPKTRAIIVARPVYSPNLYFQMIGRGLRGVLNGGNDRCLVLNVTDNIENFERRLAFSDLDWLWA